MRTKLATIGATLVLAAMVAGATLTVASAGGNEVELRFRAKRVEQSMLDLGEKGPSLGDQFIFRDVLRQGGERVGHDGGVCTFTSVAPPSGEANCQVTLSLEGGQIAVQGLVAPPGQFPFRFVVAVTGGTDRYEGASGEVHVTEMSETHSRFIIHLAS